MTRDFLPLAQSLSIALKSVQMYTAAHPRSQDGLRNALTALGPWLDEAPQFQFVAANGKAFVNGQPAEGQSPHLVSLVKTLADRQIAGLIFLRGVNQTELQILAECLLLKPQRMEELGGLAEILMGKGVANIRVSNVQYREVREGEGGGEGGGMGTGSGSGAGLAEGQGSGAGLGPGQTGQAGHGAGEGGGPGLGAGTTNLPGLGGNDQDSGGWALPRREPTSGPVVVGPSEQLLSIVRGALLRVLPPPKARPDTLTGAGADLLDLEPADLRGLGQMGYELGLGDEMPSSTQLGVLRQVLMDLPAERQLSIMAGLSSLPERPQGLALGIKALAPEIMAVAVSTLANRGMSLESMAKPIQDILAPLPEKSSMVHALGAQVRGLGLQPQHTEALMQRLEWAALSPEAKLVRVLDEGRLFELSLEQRLALLRELLDSGRADSLQRVQERLLESLASDRPELRLHASQTLSGVCLWALEPGLPAEVEGPLDQALRAHFGWEPDPIVHRHTTEGVERLLLVLLRRGQLVLLQEEIQELQNHAAMLNEAHPWRTEALGRLKAALQRPEALDEALACLFVGDKEQAAALTGPYFDMLGGPMVRHLIQSLGREQDRSRRGRIMDALRAFGPFAVTFLRESLQAQVPWFLLRNLMGLLSELGDAGAIPEILPHLRHGEPRVRRSAVRAVWKLGGPAGEPHLLALLKDTDPETKLEIVFGLGQLRSEHAVPSLVEVVEDRRSPETLRLKVLETLAFIQSPRSVLPLTELVKRKGFFGSNEPAAIRVAAAKVLSGIHPAGRQALKELADGEPKGELRDAFLGLLR
jgi:HEAT repeat protein